MLFLIDQNTPQSRIFQALNAELLYFLSAVINAEAFDESLFSDAVGVACLNNELTKTKFEALWNQLELLCSAERHQIFTSINNSQNLHHFFQDTTSSFAVIGFELVLQRIAELTKHLFSATKDLADIIRVCGGETIQSHFESFRQLNGNVCPVCGTELLAQRRNDVLPQNQWRSAYDHLLCKDKYPVYAIHPANFLPTCSTCNSKAKGADNLLIASTGERRLCFYPYSESCEQFISVELTQDNSHAIYSLIVRFASVDMVAIEKLAAWVDVYQVPSRVESEQQNFSVWLDTDCRANDFDDFVDQVSRRSILPRDYRDREWLFWRYKFYVWLNAQQERVKQSVWAMIDCARDDINFQAEFGI
jgi:hypothetical protein